MMPLLPPPEDIAGRQRQRLNDPDGIYAALHPARPDPLGVLLVNLHPIERLRQLFAQVAPIRRAFQQPGIPARTQSSVMSHNDGSAS